MTIKSIPLFKSLTLAASLLAVSCLANVATAQQAYQQAFGWPANASQCDGGCGGRCRLHSGDGHFQNFKAKMDHYSVLNERARGRNDAWPKPFGCWDRRAYHAVWTPMLMNGFEQHCVLGFEHFDANSNKLNRLGINKVADIMQNTPSKGRTVFVQRDVNDAISKSRMEDVQLTINTYYAQLGEAQIKLSNQAPIMGSAVDSDSLLQQRRDNRVPAVIQTGNAGSVAQSVGGG